MLHRRLVIRVVLLVVFCCLVWPLSVRANPAPLVTLSVPSTVRLGTPFTFAATFSNNGSTTGYGPFLDLWMPASGADGDDGARFVNAEYLGLPVAVEFQRLFPANGCLDHPYLRDERSRAIQVCGRPGDQLVVLALPFGSFTPGQPPVEVEITARVSPNADIGFLLNIQARGGFRFGATPLDDPCCDAPITSQPVSATVTPTLINLTKTNNAPENEIATGPNNPFNWTLTVDIPAGQTIANLTITDTLPPSTRFGAVTAANPPVATTVAGNTVTFGFGTVTGGAGDDDASVTFSFHSAQLTPSGDAVLPPISGAPREAYNNATATGLWTPNDPRDGSSAQTVNARVTCPGTVCPGGAAPVLKALAVQKSVETMPTGANVSPGTELAYTLDFQISDVFAFGSLTLTDLISDGQRLVPGSVALSYSQHGAAPAVGLAPANLTVSEYFTGGVPGVGGPLPPGVQPGDTQLVIRISDQVGVPILGGCIPVGGVAIVGSDYCAAFNAGALTRGIITYRTVVQDNFTDAHLLPGNSSDASVDQGDILNNRALLSGQIVSPATFAPGGFQITTDDTQAEVQIVRGQPSKSVYAINGVACAPTCDGQEIAPGDTVTYLLQHSMPNSDFENFALIDFLPLPVFSASEFTGQVVRDQINAAIPPAGTAKLFQGDTLYNRMAAVLGAAPATPTLTINRQNNTLRFEYGSFDDPANQPTQITIAFTVTVQAQPFADGLALTNLLRVREGSTNSGENRDDTIVQIRIVRPQLVMTKGIVATSNISGQFLPAAVGPVTFNPPGSSPAFNGVISSDGLAQTPVNSDLTNVQIGDRVTFAIVINNLGQSTAGAFDIRMRDQIAPGFGIPDGTPGLNLSIRLGNGAPVDYVSLPGGAGSPADLFGVGLELVDPGVGVCGPYNASDGSNIVIITYDLEIREITADTLRNTASITRYSNREGGGNLTGGGELTDTAEVRFTDGRSSDDRLITKSVDKPFAKAGERITWTVEVRNTSAFPLTEVVVIDRLPDAVTPVSARTTRGILSLSGQTYTLRLDVLGIGETVVITLVTDVRQTLEPPFVLVNSAVLYAGGVELARSQAQTVIAERLAATGESRWSVLHEALLLPLFSGMIAAGIWIYARLSLASG